MAVKRVSKVITNPEDIKYLVGLTQHDVEKLSFIMDNFGVFKGKKRFNPYDVVTIPAGSYGPEGKKNKNSFTTTVGRYVFNKMFIEQDLFYLFKYISEPVRVDLVSDISDRISFALLENQVELPVLKRFLMRCQKCQPYSNILAPSFTLKMLTMSKELDKFKKQLLTKHAKAIEAGDEKVTADIEKALLDKAKEILKDDPSMDIYGSGAKGSFKNNFKNLFVMRGAVKDPEVGKGYDIITSNYIDGISKDDYVKAAKSLAAGPYSRAVATRVGGYWEKLFLRAFQHMKLGPAGSDCGTKKTIEITLTSKNIDMWMYNYIVEGSKLVELTYEMRSKYIGKTVRMRYSSRCESEQICNKCAGNMFYRLGLTNVGTATPQIASRLKVISLKAFHDSQVRLYEIDVADAFSDD